MFLSTALIKEVFIVTKSGFEGVGGEADIGLVRFVVFSTGHWYITDFVRHWPRSGQIFSFPIIFYCILTT